MTVHDSLSAHPLTLKPLPSLDAITTHTTSELQSDREVYSELCGTLSVGCAPSYKDTRARSQMQRSQGPLVEMRCQHYSLAHVTVYTRGRGDLHTSPQPHDPTALRYFSMNLRHVWGERLEIAQAGCAKPSEE